MKSCIAVLLLLLGSLAFGQNTTTGTWTLYPAQATINQVSIRPPVNTDGSSVWSSKATVPIQYDLLAGYGPVVFASYGSGSPAFSYLDFTFTSPIAFSQLTNLSAVYAFASGNCHGGSLRWQVTTAAGNVFIYYGGYPNFTDCNTPGPSTNQSGLNMLTLSDLRSAGGRQQQSGTS